MTLQQVKDILDAQVLTGEDGLGQEIHAACGSDVMSDVLAYVKDQSLLLTGLMNTQVIRTADVMDMKCIVFVRGKLPDEHVLALARDRDIAVMTTEKPMYLACGMLYAGGLKGA